MSAKNTFRIGLVQMSCGPDPDENLARAIGRIRDAAAQGANVVCLPELFLSRYFCQEEDSAAFDLSETVPGPTTQALSPVARETGCWVLAPVFERRAAGVYHNSIALLDGRGDLADLYRKMHIPDDPGYYEKYYFTPGDRGFKVVDAGGLRIGMLICWDQWYPEAARMSALMGAHIVFYPTAIGWLPDEKGTEGQQQLDAWRTVQRGHAITNGMYVAAVNRVGFEPGASPDKGIEFWGGSFLSDPFGRVVCEAGAEADELLVTEVDLNELEDIRRTWPFLRDRRIDAYEGLIRRYLDE